MTPIRTARLRRAVSTATSVVATGPRGHVFSQRLSQPQSPGTPSSLPLLSRPSHVIFVDDDRDFLEALAGVVSPRIRCTFFTHPGQVLQAMEDEAPFAQADVWHHESMVRRSFEGVPLAQQLLNYWSTQTERFSLTHVVVSDAHMPAMTGIELFEALGEFPCRRVLVTGDTDLSTAISAFNRDSLDYFLAKHDPDLLVTLEACLQRHTLETSSRTEAAWALALNQEQHRQLRQNANTLLPVLRRHFVEYAIIGSPFGALGIDTEGRLGWLQFVTPMAGTLPSHSGNAALLEQLLSGAAESRSEVQAASQAFGTAFFDLSKHAEQLPAITHFDGWLSRQPARRVEIAGEA